MKLKRIGVQLRLIPLGLWLILLAGCQAASTSTAANANQPANNQPVSTAEFEGVIFSQENAAATKAVWGAESYWTPTQAEIMALEEKLGPYLAQTAPQSYPGPLKPLPDYKRQYIGFVAEGKQAIFVNFFCQTHDIDWHEQLISVEDGGSCYFEVDYDPQTGAFSHLSIHGES
jgi:hypothetical protein